MHSLVKFNHVMKDSSVIFSRKPLLHKYTPLSAPTSPKHFTWFLGYFAEILEMQGCLVLLCLNWGDWKNSNICELYVLKKDRQHYK